MYYFILILAIFKIKVLCSNSYCCSFAWTEWLGESINIKINYFVSIDLRIVYKHTFLNHKMNFFNLLLPYTLSLCSNYKLKMIFNPVSLKDITGTEIPQNI
jgi:hypothetical protein